MPAVSPRLILVAALVALALLAAGCRTSKETDQVAYIIEMGIDKAPAGKLKVTYRTMLPRAVGGPQGAGQETPGGPYIIKSFDAANTAEAHNLLGTGLSRYPNLNHLKAILIGEELAREGVGDIVAPLVRYREYRSGTFIAVVRGRAADWMTVSHPGLDYVLSKYWENTMISLDDGSYYTRSELHDFYLRLKNPGGAAYATYVGLTALGGADRPADAGPPGDRADAYLPGGIPRTGAGNNVEFAGAAVFAGDKMVGALDTGQTRVLRILNDDFPRGFFVLADPLAPGKTVNVHLRNGGKPSVAVTLDDGREAIAVNLFLEGELTGVPSGLNYEAPDRHKLLEDTVAALVAGEVRGFIAHTQQLGSDVFGFGYRLRPHFATYRDMAAADFPALYRAAAVDVKVTVKIRRTGLLWRTSPYLPAAGGQ